MQIDVLSKPNVVGVGEEGETGSRPGKYWKRGLRRSPELEPDSKKFEAAFRVEVYRMSGHNGGSGCIRCKTSTEATALLIFTLCVFQMSAVTSCLWSISTPHQ